MIEIKKINNPGEECVLITITEGSSRNAPGMCFMYEPGTTFEFGKSVAGHPVVFFPSKKELKHWKF